MVDGRKSVPVDIVDITLFTGFFKKYVPGGAGFLPSTVCQRSFFEQIRNCWFQKCYYSRADLQQQHQLRFVKYILYRHSAHP